jgi:hypothetical protein
VNPIKVRITLSGQSNAVEELKRRTPEEQGITCLVYLNETGPITATQNCKCIPAWTRCTSRTWSNLASKAIRQENAESLRWACNFPGSHAKRQPKPTPPATKIEALDAEFFKKIRNSHAFHQELLSLIQ